MTTTNKIVSFLKSQPRWRLVAGGGVFLLILFWMFHGGKSSGNEITFVAKRGPLKITVLEGGSIEAMASQEIRSEVKGGQGTKILKIVEEGYQVTEEDVKKGKVLVELDSSDLRQKLTQQEIQFQSALSSLTESSQGYEIQRNQNVSNVKAAEQKAQFARMDLEKYMGDKASSEIVHLLKFDQLEAAVQSVPSGENAEQEMLSAMEDNRNQQNETENSTNKVKGATNSQPAVLVASTAPVAPPSAQKEEPPVEIDFSKYAKAELLGDGSAMQQLRKLTDDLQSAQQQQGLSQTKLAGTRRLFEKGFATKTELQTDEISDENNTLKVKTAETAYNLFIKYEFPRQAQDLVSKYEEALRSLEREKKEAISKLAQARARLKGAESRYSIEAAQRKELLDQIEKCVIRAQKTGLVVYGGGSEGYYYGGYEQIREGATVRERQPIITIPDMTQMAVKVKVHESYIQKVQKGLKATIVVDAFPDKKLKGEVVKVALLPDSQNRWMNPDLKVYQTTVAIQGVQPWLKPGMSAKVEILVKQLADVVYVPLQAVTENNHKNFVYVVNGRTEMREVKAGDFNDEFIEIKEGLKASEKVLLRAPDANGHDEEKGGAEKDSEKPKGGDKKEKVPAKEKLPVAPAGPPAKRKV